MDGIRGVTLVVMLVCSFIGGRRSSDSKGERRTNHDKPSNDNCGKTTSDSLETDVEDSG